jgi:hypothetical protein
VRDVELVATTLALPEREGSVVVPDGKVRLARFVGSKMLLVLIARGLAFVLGVARFSSFMLRDFCRTCDGASRTRILVEKAKVDRAVVSGKERYGDTKCTSDACMCMRVKRKHLTKTEHLEPSAVH